MKKTVIKIFSLLLFTVVLTSPRFTTVVSAQSQPPQHSQHPRHGMSMHVRNWMNTPTGSADPTVTPLDPNKKLDEDTERKRRPHCDASGSQHGSEVRESADQACDLRSRGDEIRPAAWQKRPTLRRHRKYNLPADFAAGIPQDEGLCLRWSGEHRRARPARPHYDHVLNARTDLRGNE